MKTPQGRARTVSARGEGGGSNGSVQCWRARAPSSAAGGLGVGSHPYVHVHVCGGFPQGHAVGVSRYTAPVTIGSAILSVVNEQRPHFYCDLYLAVVCGCVCGVRRGQLAGKKCYFSLAERSE